MHPTPPQAQRHTVPPPVAAVLSRLPAYPGSLLLVAGLNHVLARQLPADVGARLLGQRIRIHVRDAGLKFDFAWQGSVFRASAPQPVTELTLSANAHDFMRLARRLDDPDTLFFNRRLSMEGDTELGLVVKNALDALELPVFDLEQWKPSAVLSRLQRLRPSDMPWSRHERH
ncbi:MAG: SCP2 sterol-binding domain-containing protein [Serpentinimonas sp.]|nr:SCP2 sterol-binding domain-containing protein [Serpentinimonas sp.]MDO9611396.1 SCP2 sterol-binding domain-containing protein [Serpentinimonas sp.]